MTTVLTVDDSRAVRTIVSKQVKELGYDVKEAEDGEQGLAKLAEGSVDLILLDVTMPVLDGPGMLARMRDAKDKTPVIMLTSESKRSVVTSALKLGIDDYILKPFKPEDLRAKMIKVLQKGQPEAANAAPEPSELPKGDILAVDDMDNVHKKLRSVTPERLQIDSHLTGAAAIAAAKAKIYKVVLVDSEMPDCDAVKLAAELKAICQGAPVLAMALRTTHDISKEMAAKGFDGVLHKPFSADSIEDFVDRFFESDALKVTENVLALALPAKPERMERALNRVQLALQPTLKALAANCFESVVVDLSSIPAFAERIPRLLVLLVKHAGEVGLKVAIVGNDTVKRLLSGFEETKDIPLFATVADAKAAEG
jgi:DNA-binding response OmpR family regulator